MSGQNRGGWNLFQLLLPVLGDKDEEHYHVVPIEDLHEHPLEPTCWCKPEVEAEGHVTVFTHNSADRREDYETGARLVS